MKYFFMIPLFSFLLISCGGKGSALSGEAGEEIMVSKDPGACPYLTTDNKGALVLSWVSMINDSSTAFCYAKADDRLRFSEPVIIPGTGRIKPHGENLPKIIFKPSGEIIALWGTANPNPRNKFSGLVYYTQSFDEGKTWTTARPLVDDTAGYDQRYYDVALLPGGEAGIIWLDNRKTSTKEGSALFFSSTKGTDGFEGGRLISQPSCPCCRTDMFVDKQGGIHALFRGIYQDSIRDMVHVVSHDGGKTFSGPERISEDNWVIDGCPHTGPAMTENQHGLHFAWYTGAAPPGCYYTNTRDNGKSFAKRETVASRGSHPQLTSLPGGELLIAWDEAHVVDGKAYRKIGLERRSAEGESKGVNYITPDNADASYPVVSAAGGLALVAYTVKKEKKDFVAYRVVGAGQKR